MIEQVRWGFLTVRALWQMRGTHTALEESQLINGIWPCKTCWNPSRTSNATLKYLYWALCHSQEIFNSLFRVRFFSNAFRSKVCGMWDAFCFEIVLLFLCNENSHQLKASRRFCFFFVGKKPSGKWGLFCQN